MVSVIKDVVASVFFACLPSCFVVSRVRHWDRDLTWVGLFTVWLKASLGPTLPL